MAVTVNCCGVLQSVLVKVSVDGSIVAHWVWLTVPLTVTSAVGGASSRTSIVPVWPSAKRIRAGDVLIPGSSSSSIATLTVCTSTLRYSDALPILIAWVMVAVPSFASASSTPLTVISCEPRHLVGVNLTSVGWTVTPSPALMTTVMSALGALRR